VLDHVICSDLEPFLPGTIDSFALRLVLQNLLGSSSSVHTVDVISPVVSKFACVL